MVFFPIADKLSLRRDQETLNRRLIMDGVLAIQDGQKKRIGFTKPTMIQVIDMVWKLFAKLMSKRKHFCVDLGGLDLLIKIIYERFFV